MIMKYRQSFLAILAVAIILIPLAFTGVYAAWVYFQDPEAVDTSVSGNLGAFHYGPLYITSISSPRGNFTDASVTKISYTDVTADLKLASNANSTASVDITFYNSTEITYYYNEAQTVSSDNDDIVYAVSGIAQKDPVEAGTYKTLTVTFSYDAYTSRTKTELMAQIHFSFVVDKDSIGIVVARTAVDRFREILNNIAAPDSYTTLETAMNNRGGYNKASDVTYIGNVVGSSSSDSSTVRNLFGDEFMSMDLNGDGTPEPITMMIKRENLDDNLHTGASYTYINRNTPYTVEGVEMTLYITSHDLDSVRNGASVVVYAATFTVPEGGSEWIELVPLTKGTAPANSYTSGDWGWTADSFNTSKWKADNGKSIQTLVDEALAAN